MKSKMNKNNHYKEETASRRSPKGIIKRRQYSERLLQYCAFAPPWRGKDKAQREGQNSYQQGEDTSIIGEDMLKQRDVFWLRDSSRDIETQWLELANALWSNILWDQQSNVLQYENGESTPSLDHQSEKNCIQYSTGMMQYSNVLWELKESLEWKELKESLEWKTPITPLYYSTPSIVQYCHE